MKNDIPWHRKHRTSNGKCKLYQKRILGTFVNGMATVRYITSLSLTPHKTGLHTWDGFSENSYFEFSKKKLSTIICVLWFRLQLLSEGFLILLLRRTERDLIKIISWYSCKVSIILVRFEWKLNFFELLSKISNIKFHENPSSGSPVVPCRMQTDGQT